MDINERINEIRKRHTGELIFHPPSVVVPDTLWIGSMWDARNVEWLQETGITHVVNCASALASYQKNIIPYTNIQKIIVLDTDDNESFSILGKPFEETIAFCNQAFAENPNSKVLFHCMAGVNRSAALVMAYATIGQFPRASNLPKGERFVQVYESLMCVRSNILTNRGFFEQLRTWIQE